MSTSDKKAKVSSALDLDNTVLNRVNYEEFESDRAVPNRATNERKKRFAGLSLKPKQNKALRSGDIVTNEVTFLPYCADTLNPCNENAEKKRSTETTTSTDANKRLKSDDNTDFVKPQESRPRLSLKNTQLSDNSVSCSNLKDYDAFKEYLESSLKKLDLTLDSPNLLPGKDCTERACSAGSKNCDSNVDNIQIVSDEFSDSESEFLTSQVIRDLDKAVLYETTKVESHVENDPQVSTTKPSPVEPNKTASESTKTVSDCRKEITQFFDEIELSIYEGPNQEECSFLKHHPISQVNKRIPLDGSANWYPDTQFTNISLCSNKSFGSVMKKALSKNADISLTANVPINATIVEAAPCFHVMGPFYGLPNKVKELIKLYKSIDKLYDWQDECLKLEAVQSRKNLIYALPTSGGKTLVAEILMLREILCRKRNAMFVLPYVAIVQEKVWALSPFAVALDFLVEEYASSKGAYPPRKRRRKNSVYIATIEKALGLINSLYETGRIEEIGLVVVDEIHLVGEQGRGATLEALLTKLMHINVNIQIIGMSATVGNLPEICTFLNADVYQEDFRPVELTEYVKCDREIAKINWNVNNEEDLFTFTRREAFNYSDAIARIDPDRLGGLVMEVIPKESCLIFCPSKKSCENVAYLLCKVVFATLKEYRKDEKEVLRNALKDESGSLCEILNVSTKFGIAYHHSGLTNEERKLIEDGFRAGILSVICCTSTLAAGVNLPAKRVILRKPYIGKDFINLSRYKQMVGRAGRAGLGELGESILICDSVDLPKVKEMLMSPMDRAISSLNDTKGKGLRHLLLSCISLGMANTRPELLEIVNKTLMAVQREHLEVNVKKITDQAISDLFKLGALQVFEGKDIKSGTDELNTSVQFDSSIGPVSPLNLSAAELEPKLQLPVPLGVNLAKLNAKKKLVVTNKTKLVISKLGKASIKGSFELSRAHLLYEDLLKAQTCLVLLNDLHLLYLVIPFDMIELVKPCLSTYYAIFTKLNPAELHTAKVLGLDESCSVKMLSNQLFKTVPEKLANRFYLTLILYDLWKEVPVFEVAEKFEVNRGLVQTLMTTASAFASNVVSFCEELDEFWAFSHLIKGMSERLSHCCVREIVPLMELPSVKQNRAKQLYQAGYTTLQKVAKADPKDLQRIDFVSSRVANQLIAAAKMLLLEKVENLREEAEDVLEGVNVN